MGLYQARIISINPFVPRRFITRLKLYARKESPVSAATLTFPIGQQIARPVPSLYCSIWMLHNGVTLSQMLLVWIKPKYHTSFPWTFIWRHLDFLERKIYSACNQPASGPLVKGFRLSDFTLFEGDRPGLGKRTFVIAFLARNKSTVAAGSGSGGLR